VAEVVVRLEAEEAEELLHWSKGKEGVDECDPDGQGICVCCNARRKLRAALDSPPVEEETEYRVVGNKPDGEEAELFTFPAREPVRDLGDIYRAGDRFTNVRDQSRTITTFSDGSTFTSPWTDLPSEEGER
jgi:hypothetical protein